MLFTTHPPPPRHHPNTLFSLFPPPLHRLAQDKGKWIKPGQENAVEDEKDEAPPDDMALMSGGAAGGGGNDPAPGVVNDNPLIAPPGMSRYSAFRGTAGRLTRTRAEWLLLCGCMLSLCARLFPHLPGCSHDPPSPK